MADDHTRFCEMVRRPRVGKNISGIPNRLNGCVVFTAYTQYKQLALEETVYLSRGRQQNEYTIYKCGRGPRVGDPCFK